MEGFDALSKLEKDVQSVETRLKALSMSAGDAAAYTARYQFGIQLKSDLTPDQDSKLDELVSRKAAAEAAIKAAEEGKRAAETTGRREESIERVISTATRELEIERLRAGALGRSAAETERLMVEERLLQQIRDKGREPNAEELVQIRAIAAERGKLAKSTRDMKEAVDMMSKYGDVLSSNMERAFSNWTNTGKFSVKDMVGSMLRDLAMLEFKRGVMGPLFGGGGIGGGETGGGLFGTLASAVFGGFRESGGDVEAGKAYVVGERRPELFIPRSAGRIEPSIGGGGGAVHVYVHASNEFEAKVAATAGSVVAERAPAIAASAVSATQARMSGMIRDTQARRL
jgi:hypothetical protein